MHRKKPTLLHPLLIGSMPTVSFGATTAATPPHHVPPTPTPATPPHPRTKHPKKTVPSRKHPFSNGPKHPSLSFPPPCQHSSTASYSQECHSVHPAHPSYSPTSNPRAARSSILPSHPPVCSALPACRHPSTVLGIVSTPPTPMAYRSIVFNSRCLDTMVPPSPSCVRPTPRPRPSPPSVRSPEVHGRNPRIFTALPIAFSIKWNPPPPS
mmetsp:Transcript_27739/g.40996  ORF Transcript_27739/g.40996 Transcript_27739/m.40996 type:complete len:210 (-) Transcript_27739:572-1201(-)